VRIPNQDMPTDGVGIPRIETMKPTDFQNTRFLIRDIATPSVGFYLLIESIKHARRYFCAAGAADR